MSTDVQTRLLSDDQVASYREKGFIAVRGVLTREEALEFRAAAEGALIKIGDYARASGNSEVFKQALNAWQHDETMRVLTLDPKIGALAEQLAGVPMRLWHDQILIKDPETGPTEFHQDQPYWPHANSTHPLTAWIALGDVPVERGCMSFIPGSHLLSDLGRQDLKSESSLFEIAPSLTWEPRETYPLQAGDLTFHHGRCAHMANANRTKEARVAHAIIFIDADSQFNGNPHPITKTLDLVEGVEFPEEQFPRVGTAAP
jgi:ectoine hydroxylase-related dioxygenase (phytanoyl-CoA dioxygenase family)